MATILISLIKDVETEAGDILKGGVLNPYLFVAL
jgi:hypothetical protein